MLISKSQSGSMSVELLALVNERLDFLDSVSAERRQALRQAPPGMLRGSAHGKVWQYYCRRKSSEKNGHYIPQNNDLVNKLGEKGYNELLLKSAEAESKYLKKLIAFYKDKTRIPVEAIYDKLPAWHKPLVEPLVEPIETVVAKWEAEKYKELPFSQDDPTDYYTMKHERVRSKSELTLANLFYNYGIPYHYEMPLYLRGYGTIYPDFKTLNIRTRRVIYWEHLGLMDDPDYVNKAIRKIHDYERNGIFIGDNLIITMETKDNPLNMTEVNSLLRKFYGVGVK